VDEFVASGQGVALLAAPSGMGKTALACHLADR
jgi:ATP/maltotriose-dependent transcriptional regulator MalT